MTAATHYQQNLAGASVALHADHPQAGYYKMRLGKGGPWVPVAIWEKDGVMVAMRGDGKGGRTRVEPDAIWTYVAGNPVKQAEAKYAFEHGSWEGDAPAIGDNSRQYEATYEGISAEYDDYAELVQQFLADINKAGGIKEKALADRANNMADAIGDVKGGIARRAEEMREALVRPHLDATLPDGVYDCEDYAWAKITALWSAGLGALDPRAVVVRIPGSAQLHMVVELKDGRILDNRYGRVQTRAGLEKWPGYVFL